MIETPVSALHGLRTNAAPAFCPRAATPAPAPGKAERRLETTRGPGSPKPVPGVLTSRWSGFTLNQSRCQQRNHQLMMARDGVSAAARFCGAALDYIQFGTVMLQKIEVHGSKVRQWIPQVAHHRYRF